MKKREPRNDIRADSGTNTTGKSRGKRRGAGIVAGLLGLALLATAAPGVLLSASAQESFGFLTKWGSKGSANGKFNSPVRIATDTAGNVYVADNDNHRIQKFTSDGTFITKWGSRGAGNGKFIAPLGIATDSAGNVYVVEHFGDRIQKFTSDGTFITKWGSTGSGEGEFSYPTDIATDAAGNVYVADGENYRIQKFTPDGAFLTEWGGWPPGDGDGEFEFPTGIATDAAGNVYVVDHGNHRIQKFTSDGAFLTKWGHFGACDTSTAPGTPDCPGGQFNSPNGVATDAEGNVYVADTYNNRIQKFNSDGAFLTKWGRFGCCSGLPDKIDGKFAAPMGVASDADGNVYVVDYGNHRIQKFGPGGVDMDDPGNEPVFRPDALISKARAKGYVGNDIYNRDAEGQTRGAKAKRGRAKTFFIRGQNDGDATDTFRVVGCKTGGGFRVTYLARAKGSTNITAKVANDTYRLKNVAPGKRKTLRVRIKVTKKAAIGAVKACRVFVISTGDTALIDAVEAKVTARR